MNREELKKLQAYYNYCINDLKYALEHVSNDYIKWSINVINENITEGDEAQKENEALSYCERVFAYELYHQFRKLMCDNEQYSGLFFNGEQQKDNSHFKELLKSIERDKVIPDLILHQHMGTHEEGGQILYIEIKTVNNTNVYDDLKKLSDLTKTELNFVYYIFIYVDGTLEELKLKIKGQRKEREYDELDDSILCFCVKDNKAIFKSVEVIKNEIKRK